MKGPEQQEMIANCRQAPPAPAEGKSCAPCLPAEALGRQLIRHSLGEGGSLADGGSKAGDSSQPAVQSELDRVKELATVGCTDAEIAAIVGCWPKTLERRFGKVIRQARAEGAAKLRKIQWDKAAESNVPMLIWLGRQMLGQSPQAAAGADEAPPARVVLDMSQDP